MPSLWHTLAGPLLLLPTSISGAILDCANIRVDGQNFNLEKLGGPKTVHEVLWENPSIQNTTFTLDICSPLKRDKDSKNPDCLGGTRVCAKKYGYLNGQEMLLRVYAIAGEFSATHGRSMNPRFTRLKGSSSNSDSELEGLRVELHGGKFPDERSGTPQKAIIEFVCDRSVTGNEGFHNEDKMLDITDYASMPRRTTADDNQDEPEMPDLDTGKQLQFQSYKEETDTGVLRLRWQTKYACEGTADSPDKDDERPKRNGGWGVFTWVIIIVFLLAATYIIFGSWLNYNRYGARGWDLIPHGDTIRDVPFILKDWAGNAIGRLRGGDSRGGYSAV